MRGALPLGKLPSDQLARLLAKHAPRDSRIVLGPDIGHDAAVISFGSRYLVAKTDPITFASDEIGWYAVHVNANDVACVGASPRWFMATLLLPGGGTEQSMVDTIFAQISDACSEVGAALVGGHTEITHDITRPIVVGCMLGEVGPRQLVVPSNSEAGDALILTKGIAVEGTAIVARELNHAHTPVAPSVLERARGLLHDPGISVVRDAAVAAAAGAVHAFHDPTEGGLATALWELAEAGGVRLEVREDDVPILPETRAVCEAMGLDPLGLIASGALLVVAASGDARAIVSALDESGIAAGVIGRVAEGTAHVEVSGRAGSRPMRRFERDEIARLFE